MMNTLLYFISGPVSIWGRSFLNTHLFPVSSFGTDLVSSRFYPGLDQIKEDISDFFLKFLEVD